MQQLTVRELRRALEGISDDLVIVRGGSDHSYTPVAYADRIDAAFSRSLQKYFEFDPKGELEADEVRQTVFFIG